MPAYISTPLLETITDEEIKSLDPLAQARVKRVSDRNSAILREYSALQYHADAVLAKWESVQPYAPMDDWRSMGGERFPYKVASYEDSGSQPDPSFQLKLRLEDFMDNDYRPKGTCHPDERPNFSTLGQAPDVDGWEPKIPGPGQGHVKG